MPNQGSVHAAHKPTGRFPSGPLKFHTGIAETFGRLVPCGAEPRPSDPTDILVAASNIFGRPVPPGRRVLRRRAAHEEANSWPPRTLNAAVGGCAAPGDDMPAFPRRLGRSQASSPDARAGPPGPAHGPKGNPLEATGPQVPELRHANGTNAVWSDRDRARLPGAAQRRRLR